MIQRSEFEHHFNFDNHTRPNDIFFETKRIVNDSKNFNNYMKTYSQNFNSINEITPKLPDISFKKNIISPIIDNYIPFNRSSLKISEDLIYSHNIIKNKEENKYISNSFSKINFLAKSCEKTAKNYENPDKIVLNLK